MIVDLVTINIKAGNGGNGAVSFLRNGQTAKGGPDGGNGGKGGDIYVCGSTNITDLREFRYHKEIKAENGTNGQHHNLYGKKAPDTILYVPVGTAITDTTTKTSIEILDTTSNILLAQGGRGGRGNITFKNSTNQAPHHAEMGKEGERKTITIELKMIADIGLVGLPNAGKSTILSLLTNAKPQIGPYPFTTLDPTIGMLGTIAIADIPGVIKLASEGRGLGSKFLKHIEKTSVLFHCIDASSTHPLVDYNIIRKEFAVYGNGLETKPEIIILTKTDSTNASLLKKTITAFGKKGKTVFTLSMYDPESIAALKKEIPSLLKNIHNLR